MIISSVRSQLIHESNRLNSGYFLNKDAINSRLLEENSDKCVQLKKLAEVWNPPIFKRQFCENTEKAIQYCQSSDIPNTLEGNNVYINKEQALKVKAIVKDRQILVTGFGTIGNTRLVNEISAGICYANNVCRVDVSSNSFYGFVYAFLTSKYGKSQLNKNASGSVVRYIEASGIRKTLVPVFSTKLTEKIHNLIVKSSKLRVEGNILLTDAQNSLKNSTGLKPLKKENFEYFGHHSSDRAVSTFTRNISEITSISINAFNYSKRIEEVINAVKMNHHTELVNCLDSNKFFSTGSFKRVAINSNKSIKLLNQSDIFNFRKTGKLISRRYVSTENFVRYGEILVAGVGTLGEGETFSRVIFANEELDGQLVAGEFIRMRTKDEIPSGYLFSWLSSDYGFRMIRSTQTGTKLCRPIPALLKDIPVPILDRAVMNEIDESVKKAHTMLYQALLKEEEAIALVEKEIEQWQK
ncbi:restriction endonuclease subunit S [Muricauda sp. 334s03]|uniref:Restriction endonuclease subunit S n=2 Tax=Flagellimonas TaxID=444459 RepID=A0A418NBE6_9FLAO|nr:MULTISPECIES: restriction endonuclease subunit S [Allomuricauda]MDF0714569.1 restriction endonuclease subunit S [[Muricauda] yonaguniensis]RIV73263.1 restriction endonuclease subunit S [Allomuricauda aequoris]TXK07075.1 restriction endonuclease subunit S [Allomuricauda aequoris]